MDKSLKQLEDVRAAIQVNIKSIKALLQQANDMHELIGSVNDAQLQEKMSDSLKGLYATIDQMIENTDRLFDELKEYAATTSTAR